MTKTLSYILTTVKHGHVKEVAEKLIPLKEINDIHELFGQYDLILQVFTDNTDQLSNLIDEKILSIPEVERTETLIVSDILRED